MASVRKRTWTHKGEEKTAWVVAYTDAGGARRLKTFDKKKDADKHRAVVETEIESGLHVADKASITVSKALDIWYENCEKRVAAKDRLRPVTLRNFRSLAEKHLRPTLGRYLLTELNYQVIQKWIDDLAYDPKQKRSHALVKHVVSIARLVTKYSHTRGFVGRNVFKDHDYRIPGITEDRFDIPTKDELRAYLAASGTVLGMGGVARYLRPLLFVAIFCGLRQGEIRALSWDNVDFESGVIRVRKGADNFGFVDLPKSIAGVRDVPMPPAVALELKKWRLASGSNKQNLVFVGNQGRMVQPHSLTGAWKRLQRRVEEGKGATENVGRGEAYHFHALRHVCASLLIETGLQPKRIQTIMGHSSIAMTFDRYGHLFEDPDAVSAAMASIGREVLG